MQIIRKWKQNRIGYYLKKNFMKKCNKCKKTLDWEKFRKDRRNMDGYYSYCKECSKASQTLYANRIKEGTIKAF
jgi:NAD-dependent SIR2 family protein deacetylase